MIIKGILIGIGKILPGISGSLIAISLGVYENVIHTLNNFKQSKTEDYINIVKLLIGFIISIFMFSNTIIFLLNKTKYIIYVFIGFILFSLNGIKHNIDYKDRKYILIPIVLSIIMYKSFFKLNIDIDSSIIFILIGFIESVTMIIPGISGTAIFIMLGLYNKYLTFISGLTMFNFNFYNIIFFAIGILIGTVLSIKLVDFLITRYKSLSYSLIYGITLCSTFIIAFKNLNNCFIISLFFIFVGYIISKKINRIIG